MVQMPPAGAIHVGLCLGDGRVTGVDLQSTRVDVSGHLFGGLSPQEVIDRIGRVFSLCGVAQTVAACIAIEQARGIRVDDAVSSARDLMRISEMATQVLMRLCLHWPGALDLPLDAAPVRAAMAVQTDLVARHGGALGRTPAAMPAGDLVNAVAGLRNAITGLSGPGGVKDQLLDGLSRRGLQGFGALPGAAFAEQGALTRCWESPEVAQSRAEHGTGLRTRLVAAFCDLNNLLGQMQNLMTPEGPPASAPAEPDRPDVDGVGTATVETARGALRHRVETRDGKIAAYRIAAPTEYNFGADGPVAAGLLGAPADGIETAARLHVLAIDPCVEVTIGVGNA